MNYNKQSVELHKRHVGKLEVASRVSIETNEDLALAYSPGVAEPCRLIAQDPESVRDLTMKGRTVAVVTDGSSVLGLGNIGPQAGLPVMEGKAILFKQFADVDAFPICLDTQDVDEIVETVKRIAPGFGGINLEDIAAPACFEVERRLIEELDIPVMHDDQHGTAIVVLAGLINALQVVKKDIKDIFVVIAGAGAGGMGIAHLLLEAGVQHMHMIDSKGIIAPGRERMNTYKEDLAAQINKDGRTGTLADALVDADVFIGVSGQPDSVTPQMVESMSDQPIIFALSNPSPEIHPETALKAGAAMVGTGRSDFPNQINNVLAFPGIFKGALEGRLQTITPAMRVAAAEAIAKCVKQPNQEQIVPSVFKSGLATIVAEAVKRAA